MIFLLPVSAGLACICAATSYVGAYFIKIWILFNCFLLLQANRKSCVDFIQLENSHRKNLFNCCRQLNFILMIQQVYHPLPKPACNCSERGTRVKVSWPWGLCLQNYGTMGITQGCVSSQVIQRVGKHQNTQSPEGRTVQPPHHSSIALVGLQDTGLVQDLLVQSILQLLLLAAFQKQGGKFLALMHYIVFAPV